MRALHAIPMDFTTAESLSDRVRAVRKSLHKVQIMAAPTTDNINKLCNADRIVEVDAPDTPMGTRYDLSMVDAAELILGCVTLRIIVNRMQYELATVFQNCDFVGDGKNEDGIDIPTISSLEEDCRGNGEDVAKFIPFLKEMGPVAGGLLILPLHLSIEGSDPAIKAYVLGFLAEINETQKLYPESITSLEEYLIDRARVLTGRMPVYGHEDTTDW